MSTRRVHLATGPVDIVVDNNSTAGDVIATVQSTLPDQPWHGKTLLSSGHRRFDHSDHVDAENSGCGSCGSCDLVLANFSVLAPPRRGLHIATEKSGITIPQIQQLLDFVFTMVNMVGACRWAETFGDERGRPLSFEAFNLYHANYWIIGPATAATDAHEACSYVELVADSPEAQRPLWFVSHAWLEPIHLFLTCLRRHSTLRELRVPAYWVCAYANNQHALEEAISNNPRKTSFYKAMKLCRGVLLVLDTQATPFTRIWCCFEESIAVEERDTNSLLLDVAATDLGHVAHVITDGLVGAEIRVLPILGLLCKSRREQSFPMDLLQKGLSVDIATAQASKEEDKTRILNSVRCPRARTWALDTPFPTQHPRYDAVNKALASHFALTSIQQSYRNGQQAPSTLWQALRSDAERRNIQVSLTGCHNFRDPDLRILIDNLPSKLQSLRLDLAYTGLERLDDLAGASFGNALQTLVIRFAGSLRSISGLSALLCPSLRRLELWLSDLPDLEDIELGVSNKALLKLRLEELVLYVNGCPSVPRESKTALLAATRQLKQCLRRRPYMWVHIEDTNTWTLNLCLGKLKVGRSQSHLEIGSLSSPTPSAASLAEIPESQIDPFPCHCCTKFHGNSHGYCDAHRLARFYHNAFSRCHLVFQYAELLMIFFVQATADIESRGLLALIVISLYPVLWMSLDRLVGSATSICVVLISLLFASVSYALLRFDRMHRATLELSLASEAICSQAIRPANLSHLSLVFGSSADDFPNTDLRQSETDLTSNFRQARIHFLSFQNALRRALSEGEVTNATANAKIKRLADLTSQGADHDVLSCEIHCESLQQVQLVWLALSKRFQSEEEPWKIVALWDGFAQEEERRCSKIVMSMNGYLATVVLCVASLTRLQSNLSELCLLADAFGLLEDAKPRRWLQRDGPNAKGSSSGDLIASLPRGSQILAALLPVLLSLARFIAMITAAYFTCQYLFRYGPSSLHESIDQLGQHRFVKVAFGERFDGSWWDALCLSGPYAVLVVVFARDLLCFSAPTAQKRKSRQLSRIVYDRYFGVEGTYYTFKVALLQLLTILLQAFGKLHLLGGIALFAEQQRLSVAESLKVTFWLFWALLFCNSVYPNMLFIFPESMRCRYTCAMLDVFFDLGYVLTYLVMVVIGTTELHVNVSVWGNFGERSQLGFSNSISPKFAFPSEFLQYMAVYVSIAHVCCACRAVQRGQTPELEAARDARPKVVCANVRCPWVKGSMVNEFVEASLGFDSNAKAMAQLVGNTAIDGSSARKYYYFLKLMDGSTTGGKVPTSHVALEVALETKPNLLLLTEEVDDHRNNLREIVSGIADVISDRADDGKNFGTILVAEGLLAAIPEFRTLIKELEGVPMPSTVEKALPELTTWSAALFQSLPEFIQKQLLLERQSNAALQLSQLETERLMAWLVEDELKQRKKKGAFKGSFSPVCQFLGYQARCSMPSDFDSDYAYALGGTAAVLASRSCNGYMAVVSDLAQPVERWHPGGVPFTAMLQVPLQLPKESFRPRPGIFPRKVDLDAGAFKKWKEVRDSCAGQELYENPGPIQLSGPAASRVTKTIATRFSYLQQLKGLKRHLETLNSRCRPGCDLRQVKVAAQSLATLNTILDELSEHAAASPFLERASSISLPLK